MTGSPYAMSERALGLRRAFDESFSLPLAEAAPPSADFIAIRLGDDRYAIRMDEIAGVHTDVAVTHCPTIRPEFIGLAAFRGAVTPVYDLAALIGHAAAPGRWLVVAKGGDAAFAFAAFDMHFRIDQSAIAKRQQGKAGRHVDGVAVQAGRALPIISIASLVAGLGESAARPLSKGASDHVS